MSHSFLTFFTSSDESRVVTPLVTVANSARLITHAHESLLAGFQAGESDTPNMTRRGVRPCASHDSYNCKQVGRADFS